MPRVLFLLLMSVVLIDPARGGVANPLALWPKRNLLTCWATEPVLLQKTPIFLKIFSDGKKETPADLQLLELPGELKALLQKAVTEGFTPKKTGIEFSGWKNCSDTPVFDVAIFYIREVHPRPEGARYLAATDIGDLEKKPAYLGVKTTAIRINESYIRGYQGENFSERFKKLIRWRYGENANAEVWRHYLQYLFAMDVVHEFAHVAGLMHEGQVATSAELDKFDVSYQQALSLKEKGDLSPLAKKFGRYQPFSCMSAFVANYGNASEKTKLICEILKEGKVETKTEAYFTGIWTALSSNTVSGGKKYSAKELEKLLCEDDFYLEFHPAVMASRQEWLNAEDQELLQKLYSVPQSKEISVAADKNFSRKEKYMQKIWKKLIHTLW